MIEQILMISAAIWAGVEWFKQPVLKPIKERWGLSDFTYSLIVYFLILLGAIVVVAAAPNQWDFLREAGAFGYPQWAGNLLAVFALFGGNSVAHALWEAVKRLSDMVEPEPAPQ